jgi:hypothetical protein
MGEVHADNIEANFAEVVDPLNRVCLWSNCTDDRGTAIVSGRSILGIELGKPLNSSSSSVQMVQCVGHVDTRLIGPEKED